MLLVASTLGFTLALLAAFWRWHMARSLGACAVALLFAAAIVVTLPPHLESALDPAFLLSLAFFAGGYFANEYLLPKLATEVENLELTRETSDNWSDRWREKELAEHSAEYRANAEQLFATWKREHSRTFHLSAFAAWLFFGRNLATTRSLFLEHVAEYRRRYDLIKEAQAHEEENTNELS